MKLSDVNTSVGNWAACLEDGSGLSCCGWMDLHVDEPFNGYKDGIWRIQIVDVDPDAVFVHRVGGRYVVEELVKDSVISFRYDRWHGLLPRHIGQALSGRVYWKKCRQYTDWLKECMPETYYRSCSTKDSQARLIWEFLD